MAYVYAHGTGTPEDPYQVWTAEDLNGVREHLNAHFLQMAHIDLGGWGYWDPIGTGSHISADIVPFTGGFNGGMYTISNLSINKSENSHIGFFAYIDHADSVIQRVTLNDATVVGGSFSGILVGSIQQGIIEKCRVVGSSSITAGNIVGGLVGTIGEHAQVENCSAEANVATVHDNGHTFGGFAGESDGVITRCKSFGSVIGSSNGESVGGFIGLVQNGLVGECFSTGTVWGRSYVGSFTGGSMGNITDCYATGDITITHGWSGGFAGYLYAPATNSYFAGNIFNEGGEDNSVHGFAGESGASDATTCFYDSTVSGHSDTVGGATPKTTAELKDQATFDGWDFETTWAIDSE